MLQVAPRYSERTARDDLTSPPSLPPRQILLHTPVLALRQVFPLAAFLALLPFRLLLLLLLLLRFQLLHKVRSPPHTVPVPPRPPSPPLLLLLCGTILRVVGVLRGPRFGGGGGAGEPRHIRVADGEGEEVEVRGLVFGVAAFGDDRDALLHGPLQRHLGPRHTGAPM